MRRLRLPLAGVLGLSVAILPAIASSETSPTVEAVNVGIYTHYWSPSQVTVASGGTITLNNPTDVNHGVEWVSVPSTVSGPSTPTCSSGVPVGTSATAAGKEWSGTCTFTQAGTYKFYCTVHGPEMTGTVTVNADGTTTTTMSTPGATTTTPTTTAPGSPTTTTPSGHAGGALIVGAPSLRSPQHGSSVKGSLDISEAGAGAHLEVDVFAQGASLGRSRRFSRVRVGRFERKSVAAGNTSFAVTLDAQARRALKRRRRLALTVKVTLTPSSGAPLTIPRSVVQRP